MNRAETIRRIGEVGVIPVVRASSSQEALAATEAIREGGIDVLEVTMTVPGAVSLIEELVARCGERALIGAGTVLDAETARACILAGARFIVSPTVDEPTIELCRRYGVAVLPGALTPTEVVRAWQAGADLVKV
ncbi:2-dehydro-3-deoxyphosphogluconate aldolase, partial [Escherichia coli]|nr:2-dehydro-3-deoxyphosphogluconate aldolase [Escherichia coli]